jgi:ABC-2 type transport system ATP-binding protein
MPGIIPPPALDHDQAAPAESKEPRVVQLADVSFRYGSRLALSGVSFTVTRGTILGLLGPNGGGKTTLFRILATLLRPTAGTAWVLGADVVTQRNLVRRSIGVVFQSPSLDVKLAVAENLHHQGHLYGLSGRELADRCSHLLGRFQLSDRAGERVEFLSGGLRRRVEIAKALLHRPRVLILDEPSTGLDPGARALLLHTLQELGHTEDVTVLLTTHVLDEADHCDQLGLLDGGRLVALDTPAGLKRRIGGDVLSVATADPIGFAAQARERFGIGADVVEGAVRIGRERGHEFVPVLIEAFPGLIESVTVGKPTLADVFRHLTGHRLFAEAERPHEESGDVG